MATVCYLDMDGVICDFSGGALRAHGLNATVADLTEFGWPAQYGFENWRDEESEFWRPFNRSFWANLEWTPDGPELIAALEEVFGENIALLTAPSENDGCYDGKKDWVCRHLPKYRKRLFTGVAKSLAAAPCKLLVDDYEKNIDMFAGAKGKTVLIPRPWNRRRAETCSQGNCDVEKLADEIRKVVAA